MICSIECATSVDAERRSTNARLLVSELVANAVEHVARGRRDRGARRRCGDGVLRVEVLDPGPGFTPRRRARRRRASRGWGLHFVDRLADRAGRPTSTAARACGSSCRLAQLTSARYREVRDMRRRRSPGLGFLAVLIPDRARARHLARRPPGLAARASRATRSSPTPTGALRGGGRHDRARLLPQGRPQASCSNKSLGAAVESLNDHFSNYFSPKDYTSFQEDTEGQFEGVGMTVERGQARACA